MDTTSIVERTRRRTAVAGLIGLALALAACSSGGAASQPAGAATPGTAATQGAAGTPAATQAATATGQPGGGGGGGGCDLVTTGEMASALGTGALTAEADPGPPPGCGYKLNGTPVAAVILTGSGGEPSFDAMLADAGSVAVSGVGDKALFNDAAHEFLVLKGGKLLAVVVTLSADKLPAPAADVYKQIATFAAGRL